MEKNQNKVKCSHCFRLNNTKAKYCKYCGHPIHNFINDKSKMDQIKNFFKDPKWKNQYIIIIVVVIALFFIASLRYFLVEANLNRNIRTEEISREFNDESGAISDKNDNEFESEEENVYSLNEITASSTRSNQGSNNYSCYNLIDNNSKTAWCEGVSGDGIGEYITFSANGLVEINAIRISNGYHKSKELYLKNNRIKDMRIEFSDGTYKDIQFVDNFYEVGEIRFNIPKKSSYVKLMIKSVYVGSKYDDTCIDEVTFY